MSQATNRELRRLGASFVLMLPAAIPYLLHWMDRRPYSQPTGYIQADMPLYMAKAREASDAGAFGVFYGNPCNAFSGEPRIYFQPWTFALGLIHHMTNIRPGVLYSGFWFVSALAASRIFLAVFEAWVGLESRAKRRTLVAFFWGGGFLAATGIVTAFVRRGSVFWDEVTAFDPTQGWWFLNLGRNLVYPTEAFYHALAFAAFLMAGAKKRPVAALVLATVTAMCSPFAGLETLAILWLAGLIESVFSRERRRAVGFFLGVNVLCVLFVLYYLVYLNQFAEHRAIVTRMMLPWRYTATTCLAAYGPVFALTAWRFRTRSLALEVLADPKNRFLIAWAVAAFALENHDFLVAPRQPIHFTRGYVWAAFFLLGVPTLLSIGNAIARLRWGVSAILRVTLMTVLLFDNATWFAIRLHEYRQSDRNGLRLNSDQWEIVERLNGDQFSDHLLISQDERISDIAMAETRLRTILGHPLETPDYEIRRAEVEDFFRHGTRPTTWGGRSLVVVVDRSDSATRLVGHLRFTNRRFQILQFATNGNFRKPNDNRR